MAPVVLKWGFDPYLADLERAESLNKARNAKVKKSVKVSPGAVTGHLEVQSEEKRKSTRRRRKSSSSIEL